MYEHHPEFYIHSALLSFLDRKGEFGKFLTNKLTLLLVDEYNEPREDVFAASRATFDDFRRSASKVILVAMGDLEIEPSRVPQIAGGASRVRLEGTWDLTDEAISVEFKAKIQSSKLVTLIPPPSGETVHIKDLTITLRATF